MTANMHKAGKCDCTYLHYMNTAFHIYNLKYFYSNPLQAAPFTVLEYLEHYSGTIWHGVHTVFWNNF